MNKYHRNKPTPEAKAAAHNFFADMPDDLDAIAGAKGSRLSSAALSDYQRAQAAGLAEKPPPDPAWLAALLNKPEASPARAPETGLPSVPDEGEDALPVTAMRGQLSELSAVQRYLYAGRAIVTVVSKQSGTRFTFRFSKPKFDRDGRPAVNPPTFVSVLAGSDNNTAYSFIGSIFPTAAGVLKHGRKSRISPTARSAKAATWFVAALAKGGDVLDKCDVYHEGRCGRCGRRLTVPSSIESGFGPECINYV